MERGGFVVSPAGLPDRQGVFLGEFSLKTDEQPSVAEHEREALLCAVQVGIKGRDKKLNQQTQWLLRKKVVFERVKGRHM